MTLIRENLYIGALYQVEDYEFLLNLGITHIMTVSIGVTPLYPENFKYKIVPLADSPDENIIKYLDSSFEFIDEALLNGGKIIVHCAYGVSRSPTIVIAYLMKKLLWSFDNTYKFILDKRNQIQPNQGFIDQLKEYEKILNIYVDDETNEKEYRCKACNIYLCNKNDLSHGLDKKCNFIFIDMNDTDKDNIDWNCPKCNVKIGEIKLSGFLCNCGFFVLPGFKIDKTKIT